MKEKAEGRNKQELNEIGSGPQKFAEVEPQMSANNVSPAAVEEGADDAIANSDIDHAKELKEEFVEKANTSVHGDLADVKVDANDSICELLNAEEEKRKAAEAVVLAYNS